MNWSTGPLAAFDVETDSSDPADARIIQAAVYLDDPGNDSACTTWLLQPVRDIDLAATAVHGISTEHARERGEPPAEALAGILARFSEITRDHGQIPLCAYNAVYDLTVLDRELRRHNIADGYRVPFPVIDPMVGDRKLDPYRRGRRTLTSVSAAYGIAIERAHQADGDVITTVRLARAMGQKYPRFGNADLGRLQQLQASAHREWATGFEKFRRQNDPLFTCSAHWPVIPFAAAELAGTSSAGRV